MANKNQSMRLPGLDVLRAAAILMVIVAHYPKASTGVMVRLLNFGWTGVDLFFVLSGYLIGGQLWKPLAAGEGVLLKEFYLRRLLRTLPAYYVVLGVYFVLAAVTQVTAPTPPWKFLVFAQNFRIPSTFTPSWSLCVEEQFYLMFRLSRYCSFV